VTGNGNGLLVKILAPVAVMMIATLAASYGLVNRLDERVKVNTEDRLARVNMASDVTRLVIQMEVTKGEIADLKSKIEDLKLKLDPLRISIEQLNSNIEARRREWEQ